MRRQQAEDQPCCHHLQVRLFCFWVKFDGDSSSKAWVSRNGFANKVTTVAIFKVWEVAGDFQLVAKRSKLRDYSIWNFDAKHYLFFDRQSKNSGLYLEREGKEFQEQEFQEQGYSIEDRRSLSEFAAIVRSKSRLRVSESASASFDWRTRLVLYWDGNWLAKP